jgi:integrase
MLNWAVGEELIETSPAAGIVDPDPRRRQDRERDRYLTASEIRLFWLGCDEIREPFGPLFQLLLLTGARRDELAHATWGEFDLERRLWILPGARAKNGEEHITCLSAPAFEILQALPKVGNSDFLFTTTHRTPVSGFGRARQRLVAAMLDRLKRELTDARCPEEAEGAKIEHFSLHDLRRTLASGMARELKVPPHIIDKILNHTAGTIRGVARIYNRERYADERQAALEAWGRYINRLVQLCSPPNVIELTAAS